MGWRVRHFRQPVLCEPLQWLPQRWLEQFFVPLRRILPPQGPRVNGFNSRYLHVITGQDYRHTATAPVFDLVRAIRQRRLRYIGHILRMPEIRVVRRALMALTVNGTQYPEGSLLVDCPAIPFADIEALAQRRATWNTMVNRLPYTNNNINLPLLPLGPVGLIWMSYIHILYYAYL